MHDVMYWLYNMTFEECVTLTSLPSYLTTSQMSTQAESCKCVACENVTWTRSHNFTTGGVKCHNLPFTTSPPWPDKSTYKLDPE